MITCAEVEKLSGEEGNFQVTVREKPRFIDLDKCTGCGDCVNSCPVHYLIQIPKKPPLPALKPEWDRAIEETYSAYHGNRSALIAMLQTINTQFGYLPRAVLTHLAFRMGIPESEVFRVATFYSQFRFNPPGRYQIKICMGTACHVRGSGMIEEVVNMKLGIATGETTSDMLFSLDSVACFGACALAPVVVINDKVYGGITPSKMEKLIKELK